MVTHTVREQSDDIVRMLDSKVASVRESGRLRLDELLELEERIRVGAGEPPPTPIGEALEALQRLASERAEEVLRARLTAELWVALGEQDELDGADLPGLFRAAGEAMEAGQKDRLALRDLRWEVMGRGRVLMSALAGTDPGRALAALARLLQATEGTPGGGA